VGSHLSFAYIFDLYLSTFAMSDDVTQGQQVIPRMLRDFALSRVALISHLTVHQDQKSVPTHLSADVSF
jgi:hypothetical protein